MTFGNLAARDANPEQKPQFPTFPWMTFCALIELSKDENIFLPGIDDARFHTHDDDDDESILVLHGRRCRRALLVKCSIRAIRFGSPEFSKSYTFCVVIIPGVHFSLPIVISDADTSSLTQNS